MLEPRTVTTIVAETPTTYLGGCDLWQPTLTPYAQTAEPYLSNYAWIVKPSQSRDKKRVPVILTVCNHGDKSIMLEKNQQLLHLTPLDDMRELTDCPEAQVADTPMPSHVVINEIVKKAKNRS